MTTAVDFGTEISHLVEVLIAIMKVVGKGALTEDMKGAIEVDMATEATIEAEEVDHQIAAVNAVMTEEATTEEEETEGETEAEEFVTILKTKEIAGAEMTATSHMI